MPISPRTPPRAVVRRAMVDGCEPCAIGLMLLSTLSGVYVGVLIGPRVVYAMAVAGHFPAVAGRLTARAQTPAVATALQISAALVLLWTGTQESIIVYASVGLSIFSMLAMSSIYVLRWRRPDLPRPFRTPGYPLTPAIYLFLTALLTVATFHDRPRVSSYALLSILAGVPFYYVWQRRGPSLDARKRISKLKEKQGSGDNDLT